MIVSNAVDGLQGKQSRLGISQCSETWHAGTEKEYKCVYPTLKIIFDMFLYEKTYLCTSSCQKIAPVEILQTSHVEQITLMINAGHLVYGLVLSYT